MEGNLPAVSAGTQRALSHLRQPGTAQEGDSLHRREELRQVGAGSADHACLREPGCPKGGPSGIWILGECPVSRTLNLAWTPAAVNGARIFQTPTTLR